uniref:Uncharacterized protein n=1 Tax=Anopheles farauti TaxID=69004 RepID=A0A182QC29_9DIPT
MICNEDVVNWFRNLKSYSRIDTMCVMLNMCLPFELRFLGTCLEDLGRRDAPELRGAELKVNNPQEFIADIASGEPTDQRIRRKMALFLALYRACNHTYANELFKTLESWGARTDLQRLFEEDDQQELLLVYTMATNHPVFSFEQRLHCGEIFSKLKSWEPRASGGQRYSDREESPQSIGQPITLSYATLPGLPQTITSDVTLTPAHYLEPLHTLPVQTDFTIPPPGPPTAAVTPHWVQTVYPQEF